MIQNRIVTVEGNMVDFHINHTENGIKYELKDGEIYRIVISSDGEAGSVLVSIDSYSSDCSFEAGISEGVYVIEICLVRNGQSQVILPAVDERHRPLNQLIVLRRVSPA